MIKKKIIGIVVLFWNDFEKTIQCIKSIYDQKNLNYTLILVDNNSEIKYSSKIFEWLKKNNKKILNVKKKNTMKINSVQLKFVFTLKINLIMDVV